MPKLSRIEIGPKDILVTDVAGEAIARLRAGADSQGPSFSDCVLGILADHAGARRETVARASVILLDPE
jgi:hypothetical protein